MVDIDGELVVIEEQQFWIAGSDIDSLASQIDRGKICRRSIQSSVVQTVIVQDTSQK